MDSSEASLEGILAALLSAGDQASPASRYDSIDDWWPQFESARRGSSEPIDQALIGGAIADRVGYAFAAGYQAALLRMDPELPRDRMACFSVTEEGGGHPKAIQSRLTLQPDGSYQLSGRKKWATLSSAGGIALIVASTGSDDQGRNQLRTARVALDSPGVSVVAMPPTPFSPEIPHRRLELDGVRVAAEQLLPGDGYTRFVKPFRTIEDIHVSAAVLAYLFVVAGRYGWERSLREELLQLIVSFRALALADYTAAAVHIALEGVFQARHQLLARCAGQWERVDAEVRARWERDAALGSIAGNARAMRADRAWETVRGQGDETR